MIKMREISDYEYKHSHLFYIRGKIKSIIHGNENIRMNKSCSVYDDGRICSTNLYFAHHIRNIMEEDFNFDEIPTLIPFGSADVGALLSSNDETPATLQKESMEIDSLKQVPETATATTSGSSSRGRPVPLTILTGWLGAGKTTMLHWLLDELGKQGKLLEVAWFANG